jgi:LmbE family N-acetylglucosaminyl deacetylase
MATPLRAIAIAAHPDDIEFLMAGTLLLLRDVGYEIHYLNVANGCLGTTEYDRASITRIRREEAIRSAALAGAVYHESLTDDMGIYYRSDLLTRLAAIIRDVVPRIVLTHSPADYMEDHTNTARLAVSAAFCRGMPNYVTDPPRDALDCAVTVYHAQPYGNRDPLGEWVIPHFYVDIGSMMETILTMLACHASQKKWLDESQGLDSYLETCRELSREVGQLSGQFEFSEGWRKRVHLGFCGPADDPLGEALREHIRPSPNLSGGVSRVDA